MSSKSILDKTKFKSFDELMQVESIQEIPLEELHAFANHPFRVLDDEKMDETVESVRKHGILVPGIVRKRAEGGYEIISGHRRRRAAQLAGLEKMPMLVKNLTDDEAIIIMVDANIQREDISISEKAKAYSMKYEAMKHQGKGGGISLELMGEESGENSKAVQRYIYLARLTDELLQLVDEKKLGFGQGIDISWLDLKNQRLVYETIMECQCNMSGVQSAQIKKLYKEGSLTQEKLWTILSEVKKEKRKVTFNSKKLDSYFDENSTNEEIENLIISLLNEWKEKGGTLE